MLNKEKTLALLVFLFVFMGIFRLLDQFNFIPKVPVLVLKSEFQGETMEPSVVLASIEVARSLPDNWTPVEFLRDPWKEMGVWRVPSLETISPPPSLPLKGYVVPILQNHFPRVVPILRYEKKAPQKNK